MSLKLAMTSKTVMPSGVRESSPFQRLIADPAMRGGGRKTRPYIYGKAASARPHTTRKHKHQRNRADRVSYFINKPQALNLLAAAQFASDIGKPLNRFTTIHWQQGGITKKPQDATLRFLKLAGDWMRLRGESLTYIWVREGGAQKGEHVHILLHVPPHIGRAFGCRQRGWLGACGANFSKGVIYSRPIGRNLSHAFKGVCYGEHYDDHLAEALGYVLKGADNETCQNLTLKRQEAGGRLTGKRCSTSQNIGLAARNATVSP
jgi:hypothetical protein